VTEPRCVSVSTVIRWMTWARIEIDDPQPFSIAKLRDEEPISTGSLAMLC